MPACAEAVASDVGYLMTCDATDRVTIQSDDVFQLAKRLARATAILRGNDGQFVDSTGQTVSLDRFRVIWCHEGDPARQPALLRQGPMPERLSEFVRRGGGLLLSGTAATLVTPLQLDTVRVQANRSGDDYGQAGLVPVDLAHPVFRDLTLDRGVLWMSNAVFPAFAQFSLAGKAAPASAPKRLLARTPGGPEIPLLEYGLGQGRVIVLGWHVGRLYADAAPRYRQNFEGLVANLVGYLGDAKTWQPLSVPADSSPQVAKPSPSVPGEQWRSLELAIRDLMTTFPDRYPRGKEFLERLATLERTHAEALRAPSSPGSTEAAQRLADIARQFDELRREALFANPLVDFARLLVVKRGANHLGLPMNYASNSSLPPTGYDNEIDVLSPVRPDGKLAKLYRPEGGRFVGDLELHFDADRMLFSMPGSHDRWQVSEIRADGSGLRELPLVREPDVDNYDACYLPDGRIVFGSTACFTGVPCTNGSDHVSNLYLLETSGRVRQLTVEQDHDWCPTVLNNGRVLYLRWEYTDLPHAFSRILFHMNPDGTEQMEYYGSNSYWPASMFYARPIPGHPTKVVAVVGGHHELPRMGELVVFDPARGRLEANGAVQRIPGHGRKVEPTVLDLPIAQTWPKFLHPFPLSEKYFLVSCKPSADALWGIYLVDVFDNMLLVREEPGYALLEPIPLQKTPRPPVLPDKVDPTRRDAEVLITDIYRGGGLQGVPRGTVKRLRLISYQFAYQGMGAEPYSIGLDGPWDPKLVLGTVPVYDDGSARFQIPAYTPIAIQPLDSEGKAVQLMRSWLTAMPGEKVSCAGCHEPQNTTPPPGRSIAATRQPVEIEPWYGPPRGFSFRREVQPVLDRYCIGCHDGKSKLDGRELASLVDGQAVPMLQTKHRINQSSRFSLAYYQLRRLVRTPTKESDIYLLPAWEFHADTTRLLQLLDKGHYGVALDAESRDRLITWIDLGAPFHGNWTDILGADARPQWERRRAMRKLYTGMDDDPEVVYPVAAVKPIDVKMPRSRVAAGANAPEAVRPPQAVPQELPSLSIPLSDGVSLAMVRIPPGEFVMGQEDGSADERPVRRVTIDKAFWMARCEVTNQQFALFDATHDSRLEHGDFLKFGPSARGASLSRPQQPVVRVSWNRASEFCRWLSEKTGRRFTLPTEAQWEYACRAGTTTPLWYGTTDRDFSPFANVSDASHQVIEPLGESGRADVIPPWRPADTRYDDRSRVSAPVASYRPNPFGLFDMHGNVAEWTRSDYRPYPYRDDEPAVPPDSLRKKVVRGGSWYDRPDRCRSAFRQAYPACQPVYDVGFRVICEADERMASQEK
jgi:formylglycine-generating enzyme required for sulfatase activity